MENKRLNNNEEKSLTIDDVIKQMVSVLRENTEKSIEGESNRLVHLLDNLNLLYRWKNEIDNRDTSVILGEVNYDMICSIYIALNGMYRTANSCLRSAIELGLGFFYFTDNNFDYLKWKNNKYSLKWSVLSNGDNGVLSTNYLNLFAPEVDFTQLVQHIRDVYHECSEYVHGKYTYMQTAKEIKIVFNSERFEEWANLFISVSEIIIILLSIRFRNIIIDKDDEWVQSIYEILKKNNLSEVSN